jgi:hypothetical protein
MLKLIRRTLAVAFIGWGVLSALSLLSDLQFLADGLSWLINHPLISLKAESLELGKQISQLVSVYRTLVESASVLLFPSLPHSTYDGLGLVDSSIGRALWLGGQDSISHVPAALAGMLDTRLVPKALVEELTGGSFPEEFFEKLAGSNLPSPLLGFRAGLFVALAVLADAAVLTVAISVLFGIDHVYMHFA